MSPTRREQLDRCLSAYGWFTPEDSEKRWYETRQYQILLDALDALCHPTPLNRAQVEAVLQRHQFHWKDRNEIVCCASLIDDLLALSPTPSPTLTREQVEAVLEQNGTSYFDGPRWLRQIVDDLLALGREEAKGWCEHIYATYPTLTPAWFLYHDGSPVPNGWDQCPFKGCHAPRPTERAG